MRKSNWRDRFRQIPSLTDEQKEGLIKLLGLACDCAAGDARAAWQLRQQATEEVVMRATELLQIKPFSEGQGEMAVMFLLYRSSADPAIDCILRELDRLASSGRGSGLV